MDRQDFVKLLKDYTFNSSTHTWYKISNTGLYVEITLHDSKLYNHLYIEEPHGYTIYDQFFANIEDIYYILKRINLI